MHQAAAELHFELAARLRDEVGDLKKELRQMTAADPLRKPPGRMVTPRRPRGRARRGRPIWAEGPGGVKDSGVHGGEYPRSGGLVITERSYGRSRAVGPPAGRGERPPVAHVW